MTIEEVEELRKQEKCGQLRLPQLEIDDSQIKSMLSMGWYVYQLVNNKSSFNKMLNKISLKKNGVKISGKGTLIEPYSISTTVGKGVFFDVKQLFDNDKYSLESQQCFYNSLIVSAGLLGTNKVEQSCCVSGISLLVKNGKKQGMLHSVVELNDDMIADINLGIVMSKDLYKNIFMFEELTRIDGKKTLDLLCVLDDDVLLEIAAKFNLRSYHMAFALDDLMDFLTNVDRQTGHDVFADLEY